MMQAGLNIGSAIRGAEAMKNMTPEEEAGCIALGFIFQCFVKDHTEKK